MNRKKMTLFNYVNGVFLLLLVIVCILPILHVIALSLSERIEAVAGNVTFYPIGFTLEAYRYVMEDSQFWTSLRVTLTRVLIGVPANIFAGRDDGLPAFQGQLPLPRPHLLLLAVCHHHAVRRGTIPTYIVISKLGLMNTIWALTLPGAMNVSYMILIMNFFAASRPKLRTQPLLTRQPAANSVPRISAHVDALPGNYHSVCYRGQLELLDGRLHVHEHPR